MVRVQCETVPLARPSSLAVYAGGVAQPLSPVFQPPRDGCAIASAICGISAIVPVLSQVAGLTLGVMALVRIGRAKRRGVLLRGKGWAWAGLASSGFVLLSWLAIFITMALVSGSYTGSLSQLNGVLLPGQ